MKKTYIILLISLIFTPLQKVTAESDPIIVISPGKTLQSMDTVGSSIEVIDNKTINNSSYSMLGEIIGENSTGNNFFQTGGSGGNTAIQLRGLEKRYSTVYLDGVKMMDPSSADGSFYLDNLTKNGIQRVEILKGTQSSLYGSNAIGGTINIFTKKGQMGNHSDFEIQTGSKNTKNIFYSLHGADEKINYFIGLNKYVTDGISAMNDNDEQDEYRNDNVVGNFGYKINDNFSLQNSFRIADTFYDYDTVVKTNGDDNSTDNLELSSTIKLIHKKNNFKNTLSYNKLHIERYLTTFDSKAQNYFGYRDAFNYLGEYNFNLDSKIIYGVDSEVDASRYNRSTKEYEKEHDESIISQYFDYQFRPIEKLYSSFGLRSDNHSTVGRKTSGRGTLAYKLNGNNKIRSTFGAGVRFPAMYDYAYGWDTIANKGGDLEELQSERGLSFDLGYDTFLSDLDLGLSMTYFRTEQKNSLRSTGKTEWVMRNTNGVNTSEGIELSGKWKPLNKKVNLNFGYTFTDTYDADSCDALEKASFSDFECNQGGKLSSAKVRVPRHALQSRVNYQVNKELVSSVNAKFKSRVRDFGNDNDKWRDQTLRSFVVVDLVNSYNIFDSYNIYFNINNVFDKEYQHAWEYSAPGRSLSVGFKSVY